MSRLPAYASFGEPRPAAQRAEAAQSAWQAGFRATKVRVTRDRLDGGLAAVAAIREALGADVSIMVDLNQEPALRFNARSGRIDSYAAGLPQLMTSPSGPGENAPAQYPALRDVLREWGRLGCLGFGGPPTHIRLLRQLCVERRRWMRPGEFEDAIAVCNLLPGPASTQLAIYCAWRVRGRLGALVGGAAFIAPGLVVILALAALFLSGTPPDWVRGAGAGAGGAVAAVAVHAGVSLLAPSWRRRRDTVRWLSYALAGLLAAATLGPWLVLVLLGCGAVELCAQRVMPSGPVPGLAPSPLLAAGGFGAGGVLAVGWVALKVGALSYGGGFVIIPLMDADAVDNYHWMTGAQFLNAVALGQITPGPVVQTVAVVGYAAAGLAGGVLASVVAFAPSFAFVLLGARHFDRLRDNAKARALLDGAGPAAVGAILGSAVPLAMALSEPWQYAVLAGAAVLLFALRRGVVSTLLLAGLAGVVSTLL